MSVFHSITIHHPKHLTCAGKGVAAAAAQYVAAMQPGAAVKWQSFSNAVAGLGTGAAMFTVTLALLHVVGG